MKNKRYKPTAWKKSRKFGDVKGGRLWSKRKDGIVRRCHSLPAPAEGDVTPIFLSENASRDYFFPIGVEDVKALLQTYAEEDVSDITHIWFRRHNPKDESIQGYAVKGSGVLAIVLYPLRGNLEIDLGKSRPSGRALKWYSGYAAVSRAAEGWKARFSLASARSYYLERLLPHEIAHCIAYSQGRMRHAGYKNENFADNLAYARYPVR